IEGSQPEHKRCAYKLNPASRSQSLEPYLAFKGADLAFWRHLSPFQEAVHPSYPEYERRHPNVIPPFSCCFYLGISISAVFFITLRQLVRFAVQMMLDAEVTAYPPRAQTALYQLTSS
ncbi:hypothetical protein, partial [Bifidobacterium longum]|uniref:hypothetical protein n=1 Tax=Bifidobacterium longum TaxID=216816 RepID=UPI00398D4ED5